MDFGLAEFERRLPEAEEVLVLAPAVFGRIGADKVRVQGFHEIAQIPGQKKLLHQASQRAEGRGKLDVIQHGGDPS